MIRPLGCRTNQASPRLRLIRRLTVWLTAVSLGLKIIRDTFMPVSSRHKALWIGLLPGL